MMTRCAAKTKINDHDISYIGLNAIMVELPVTRQIPHNPPRGAVRASLSSGVASAARLTHASLKGMRPPHKLGAFGVGTVSEGAVLVCFLLEALNNFYKTTLNTQPSVWR
jgi:hypothetical protein